jgi:hypothetical protein
MEVLTVKRLIECLSQLDGDLEIYTAKDAEGNGYNPLYWEPGEEFALDTDYGVEIIHESDVEDGTYDIEDLKKVVVL